MRNSHALRVGRKPPRRRAVSHHSREVPIIERSGTASRKRTRIGAAHKSRFIFASRISRVQVSELVTAWGQLPERFSMLLPPTSCRHVDVGAAKGVWAESGKSQPSASAALFRIVTRDVTGPWHNGLSGRLVFCEAVGRGGDTARTVWKAVGDVSGRPGSRAGLRRRGRAGRSTRAKGLPARGTRRQPSPRSPRPVHGPRRPLAPAHSTSHGHQLPGGRGTVVRAEATPAASGPRRVAHGAAETATGHQLRGPTTTAAAGPHCEHDGAPKTAASSAGSNTRRKPAPLAPAHVAATGGRSTKSGGERRGGARDCTAPSGTADGRASLSRFPPLEPGSGSSTSGAPTWPTCPAAPAGLLVRGYKGKEAGRLGPPDASPAVPQLQADPDSGPYEGESGTFRLDKLLRLQHNIEV